MAGFLYSSVRFILLSLCFSTPVAVLLRHLLSSFCQHESFPKRLSAKSASWDFSLPASSKLWEQSNKMDSIFKVYMSAFCSFALSLRASSWRRLLLSRSASLRLFYVNVAHPLCRAAYGGQGGAGAGAECMGWFCRGGWGKSVQIKVWVI